MLLYHNIFRLHLNQFSINLGRRHSVHPRKHQVSLSYVLVQLSKYTFKLNDNCASEWYTATPSTGYLLHQYAHVIIFFSITTLKVMSLVTFLSDTFLYNINTNNIKIYLLFSLGNIGEDKCEVASVMVQCLDDVFGS